MNADPIFYTQVADHVAAALNRRKQYYSATVRDSDAHEWLFKKMAWATAKASNSARPPAEITIPVRGGLGKSGVYNTEASSRNTLKYFPKPHIESVNVSAEGDFGSIIKLELKFQVHSLYDLSAMQPFFDIGGDLSVSWGWSRAGNAGGRDGNFQGKIYNFSYNLNSAGGFDCSTYAMMPGITIIGGNADAPKKSDVTGLADELGNAISTNSIINTYKYEEQRLSNQVPFLNEPKDGLQLVAYAKDWAEAKDPSGQAILDEDARRNNSAALARQTPTQNIQGTQIYFNSNTAKLMGYTDTSQPIYEVTEIGAATANKYLVKKNKNGTYDFFDNTVETIYKTKEEAVAALNNAADYNEGAEIAVGDGNATTVSNQTNQTQGEMHLYISLERLVKDINNLAQENSSWFSINNVKIVCNENVTRGLVPSDVTKLVSANPIELLFPGYSKYGPVHTFTFGTTYEESVKKGDLSKCMISLKWLQETFSKLGTEKNKNTKSADSSVAGLLQRVFDLIYKHSGERFKLAMISNPRSTSGTEILIVDVNYIDTNSTNVNVYPITAVEQDSIARSVSLQSKVPNEFQTAAFVAISNGFSGPNAGSIGNVIGAPGGQSTTTVQSNPLNLEETKKAMDSAGVTPDNVKSLQAALKRERISLPPDSGVGTEIIPFPLDFTVTLDGIEGFIFGNAITCNYLPNIYKQSATKMAFTVTKVNHTIANNDWTTTLNTVCRIVSENVTV